jgi:hypothetical protein
MPATFAKSISPGPFLVLMAVLALIGDAPAFASGWTSVDIGDVGLAGSATETSGVWTVHGAGGDIWGTADAFHFLYRAAGSDDRHLTVRVDDLQNTNSFAKAGLMVRESLDPGAAAVILDAKPSGEIEFMARSTTGGTMAYIGGAFVTTPAWLQLTWLQPSSAPPISVNAWISQDGVTWSPVSHGVDMNRAQFGAVLAGAAITSHDTAQLNTAHFEGLSSLPVAWSSTDVGGTGFPGNASAGFERNDEILTVEGAGADVWGSADSFQFVHMQPATVYFDWTWRVVSLDDTHPFAKAGVMFRDSTAPGAMQVILDAKPSGEVEFMARVCTGCETTYLGGTTITFPGYLSLRRDTDGMTFTARAGSDPAALTTVGSIQVPMSTRANAGWAVTSHDVNQLATAVFDHPAR